MRIKETAQKPFPGLVQGAEGSLTNGLSVKVELGLQEKEKGQEKRQVSGKQVDVDQSSYVLHVHSLNHRNIFSWELIGVGVNSLLFPGFPEWHLCIICAVLSRRVQPQLKTSSTECCAMISLEKNLILIAEDKLWVKDTLPLPRIPAG